MKSLRSNTYFLTSMQHINDCFLIAVAATLLRYGAKHGAKTKLQVLLLLSVFIWGFCCSGVLGFGVVDFLGSLVWVGFGWCFFVCFFFSEETITYLS